MFRLPLQDFPYNVEEGIEHHNLWSTKPLSPERLSQACSSLMQYPDLLSYPLTRRQGWQHAHARGIEKLLQGQCLHCRTHQRSVVTDVHGDSMTMGCRTAQEIAKHRKGWEWCHWVNPASLASIPSTWHAHVLSRRRPDHAAPS